MELTVFERINLISILPVETNFIELKILHKLREELQFSEEELERGEIAITPLPNGSANWESKKANKVVKDCSISELADGIILTALKALDMQKKLRAEHRTLYEKFVLAKEPPPEKPDSN